MGGKDSHLTPIPFTPSLGKLNTVSSKREVRKSMKLD